MLSTRNPYSFPKYEGDNDFVGLRSSQQVAYSKPSHLAQRDDPWNRLSLTGTLSSSRKEAGYFDPEAPGDSLDFVLKTEYNQHREFDKGKSETVLQKETLGKPHNRILKNRTYQVPPAKASLGHPLRVVETPEKRSIHSVKNAITGHHTQTTNCGYSRKPDGGFFTS